MKKKILIIHVPVLHRGYLNFFKKNKEKISEIYLIDNNFIKDLSDIKPDIASIDTKDAIKLIKYFGFNNIKILSKDKIKEIKDKEIILIQDEISRNLQEKYLKSKKVEWLSVFLRWDKISVMSEKEIRGLKKSKNPFDVKIIKEAYKETEKSGDWWRRVGAILVKNKKILFKAYNKNVLGDHVSYQLGEIRDFLNPGEMPDLAATIHAEQRIIAEAAKEGISIKGTSIYVTHFPCPVCAKLIAFSGIKKLYFSKGYSISDGQKVLKSAKIDIIKVQCNNI